MHPDTPTYPDSTLSEQAESAPSKSHPQLQSPTRFVETHDPAGPFGAKGVGEPGLVPTAPAIANAIYDAVGVRVRDLPITPEKLLQALNNRRA